MREMDAWMFYRATVLEWGKCNIYGKAKGREGKGGNVLSIALGNFSVL